MFEELKWLGEFVLLLAEKFIQFNANQVNLDSFL